MEHLILKTLSFNLSVPTCDSFMARYLLAGGIKNESQLHYLVKVSSFYFDDRFLEFIRPSQEENDVRKI